MRTDNKSKLKKNKTGEKSPPKQKAVSEGFDKFIHIFELNQSCVNVNKVPSGLRDLYDLIKQAPLNRAPKALLKLRKLLEEMDCFKPQLIEKDKQSEILRKDNLAIIEMIAPFIQMTYYNKGCILEIEGKQRESLKFILNGEICIFEPGSSRNYNSCELKHQNNDKNVSFSDNNFGKLNSLLKVTKQNPEETMNSLSLIPEIKSSSSNNNKYPPVGLKEPELIQNLSFYATLKESQCLSILFNSNIIQSETSHKMTKIVRNRELVCSSNEQSFIDQKDMYNAIAMCVSDCILIEIGFPIAKEVLSIIRNDRLRQYVHCLLNKFPFVKYAEAKQYIGINNMIEYNTENDREAYRSNKSISNLHFELPYTKDIYLIVKGSVTLVIDQVSERKSSTIEYAIPLKKTFTKELLHLYTNDIFGFEELGENKTANLRYLASLDSQILKINENSLFQRQSSIDQFNVSIQEMASMRNSIIHKIVSKLSTQLEEREIQRIETLNSSKEKQPSAIRHYRSRSQLAKEINEIMQVKYFGHQNYESVKSKIKKHFSPENENIEKQALSIEIAEQSGFGIEFSNRMLGQVNGDVKIKEGWVEMRGNEGNLLRRKKLKEIEKEKESKCDSILSKIGILSSKEIADHNYKMVRERASKYEFEDIDKEAKEFRRIRKKSESLPKLTKLFSRKESKALDKIKYC